MSCKIAIVGEAWGEHEERQRAPFVGPSGYELTKMLSEAGIHRAECYLTNVFNLRPRPTNDIENLCTDKASPAAIKGLPPLKAGKYLRTEYLPEVMRLHTELSNLRPNLTIAMGNTAAWALLHSGGISKIRGTVTPATAALVKGLKVLPTYHPAAVLREWSLRPVTVLDFCKAKRESEFPEIRRPERTVYIDPSLSDLEWYYEKHLRNADCIAFDIETAGEQITCIGFSPSPASAIVVPFVDPRKPACSFWGTPEQELQAWGFVKRVLALPCPKRGQNTLYDITFLWRGYGITVNNYEDDSMLMHHALQPESEKGLAFLGSVYTNESSWKLLRTRGKTTIKRDE